MSEIHEFTADVDGDGKDDYVVAERAADGSIITARIWTATGSSTW